MDIDKPPSRVPFPVVGIGASAGGYPALMTLLQNMPPHPGMALVVILHLAADEPSGADRLLQSATDMPVVQVTHTMPVLPDNVYVIPPDRSLAMRNGELVLDRLDRSAGRPVAVDIFLRTLAEAHREYAIGVVLSGMGSDGTAGLACIKEMGGVAIAQLPTDAEHGGMPRSAIESGMADFVLPAGEIPRKLIELRDVLCAIRRKACAGHRLDGVPLDMGPRPEVALRDVLEVLHERTGHDFTHYRRPTLLRRLERRVQVRGMPDLASYYRVLQKDSAEAHALLKDLLIGVTSFYRDREAFEALERMVLPGLFRSGAGPLRAWVAACSTGEEAYTVAMLLAGQAARHAEGGGAGRDWQVFASDIDEHAIEVARAGLYPDTIAESVPEVQLQRWFTRHGDRFKVRKPLRDRVLFARHNLLHEPAFSRLDLICCRNFLIYLNREMHRHLLQQFHFGLNPGGYLMLGSAESVEAATDLFVPVDAAQKIYQARRVARPVHAPAAPASVHVALGAPAAAGARDAVDPASSSMRRGRLFSFADIHLHKAAELAPPSILLNADGDILHISEQAADFLRQAGGEPTRELVRLVPPELQLALRVALFQARKSGHQAGTGPLRYERAGRVHALDLQVLPFQDPHAEDGLMLVRFVALPDAGPEAAQAPAAPQDQALLGQLDEELRRTRRQLRETVEQAETASSEMRLYSEEMQATVEELRASVSELERSRADLLSANQELAATNLELQRRATDSAKAHDDLVNLVVSSDVATIFLDRDMRILRYTPRIAEFFNVIPADLGRPLLHITTRLDYPRLAEDAAEVFATLQALEREVRSKDGRDYIVRMHPYRTTEHRIDGAVLTFFDITQRKRDEELIRESAARLHTMFESLPVGVGVYASSGAVLMANRIMHRYLPTGLMPSRDQGRSMRWRAWHADGSPVGHDDFPGSRALRGEWVVPGIEMLYRQDDGCEIWTQVAAAAIIDDQGRATGEVAVVINDIDALKRTEEALRENEALLRDLLGGVVLAVWETDRGGRVVTDSPSWRACTGQRVEEWMGEGWIDALHPDDRDRVLREWRGAVARRGTIEIAYRLRLPAGGWRPCRVRALPLFNLDGTVRKWIGVNVAEDGNE
jgi:two-component system CheB/CheR fusion protein